MYTVAVFSGCGGRCPGGNVGSPRRWRREPCAAVIGALSSDINAAVPTVHSRVVRGGRCPGRRRRRRRDEHNVDIATPTAVTPSILFAYTTRSHRFMTCIRYDTMKVKCLVRIVGATIISLPYAVAAINHRHMTSATLDLRLPSLSQGISTPWPTTNYTAWRQSRVRANNLPKVATWKRNGWVLNLRPLNRRVHYLTGDSMGQNGGLPSTKTDDNNKTRIAPSISLSRYIFQLRSALQPAVLLLIIN